MTILVPRWGADASGDWYPWIARHIALSPVALAPAPSAPEIEPSCDALQSVLRPGQSILAHSVGCQVVLRTLARGRVKVGKVLLVAAWFDIDDPWPSIVPWCREPFDARIAGGAAERIEALISDNDPFTSDFDQTRRELEDRTGAKVTVCTGLKHFNREEEPMVLNALEHLLA